jgi:hypothetical protein
MIKNSLELGQMAKRAKEDKRISLGSTKGD